jgi:hypothetical protein
MKQPEGSKPKMRQLKLKRGVNSEGMLRQKGIKQGLVLYIHRIDMTFM